MCWVTFKNVLSIAIKRYEPLNLMSILQQKQFIAKLEKIAGKKGGD